MRIFIFLCLTAFIFAACGNGIDDSPPALVGEACDVSADCETDDCRLELTGQDWLGQPISMDLTNGMCTADCTWQDEGTFEERLQSDCDDGGQCLGYGGGDPLCFQGCETADDCRADYDCTDLGEFSTCLPREDAARIVEESLKIRMNPATKVSTL